MQLYHGGRRSPADLIGTTPVCPSDDEETGARALTTAEVESLVADFVTAAERAERAGFEGVEIHGAHGYILCQFLSSEVNRRTDRYGGTLENRSRVFFEIIDGIRANCRPDFIVGVRLSAERFELRLGEMRSLAARLCEEAPIDFLEMSMWDVFKEPIEEEFQGQPLLDLFTNIPRGPVRLGAAGKILSAASVRQCLQSGLDFAVVGRGAILHHDFPQQIERDHDFHATKRPVSRDYLRRQGLGEAFIEYMATWRNFVAEEE